MNQNTIIPSYLQQIKSNQIIDWKKTAEKIYQELEQLKTEQNKIKSISDNINKWKNFMNACSNEKDRELLFQNIVNFFPKLITKTSSFELSRQENRFKEYFKRFQHINLSNEYKLELINDFIDTFIEIYTYEIPDLQEVFNFTYTNFFESLIKL